ncbi:MAG: hypothetical protein QM758_07260 [Armatimonas sp.]
MSRWKFLAVRVGIPLVLGAIPLWYQSYYVMPLASLPAHTLPSPNGYDTFQEAMDLVTQPESERQYPQGTASLSLIERQDIQAANMEYFQGAASLPLTERQKTLAANQRCIAKTREALTQEYLVPRRAFFHPEDYDSHLKLLRLASQTYSDSGDLPKAMQCALDTIALGVNMPRGGGLDAWDAGAGYEATGQFAAWRLANRVDAQTARQALARLEPLEEQRWPLPENLRENLWRSNPYSPLNDFKEGPFYIWGKLASASETLSEQEDILPKSVRAFWYRTKAVYGGPKALMQDIEAVVKRAQEHFDQPWQPGRSELPLDFLVADYPYYGYSSREAGNYSQRAQAALLRTYLALRAYRLERGSYPQSLEQLVSAGYLKSVPKDPFSPTRSPLRYAPDGKLWSVGPNATDDNGQVPGKDQLGRDNYQTGDMLPPVDTTSKRTDS